MPGDLSRLQITSPYGEPFGFKDFTANEKVVFYLNACPKRNLGDGRFNCIENSSMFYHTRQADIALDKNGFHRIEQIVDLSTPGEVRSVVLDLLPLKKKFFNILLVDNDQQPVNGYYRRIDTLKSSSGHSWQAFNEKARIENNGPLNLIVKSPGYKPHKVKLDAQGDHTIALKTTEIPLWVILHAATPLKQTWKITARIIGENIEKMYKQKRLDKDQVWFSFYTSGIMNGPFKIDPADGTAIERMIRSRKPHGPTESLPLLQNIGALPESVQQTFNHSGFRVIVISPFDELFLERDTEGNVTSLAQDRFNDINLKFLDWLNSDVIIQSLSQLQLIDLDFANKAYSGVGEVKSALGHVEGYYGDGGVTILYRRCSNPTDLNGVF